jgi:glycine/D-amino acid oxidase-like deaminating enzyme
VLHDNEKVLEIIPGEVVQVKTSKGFYKAKNLIVTPGNSAISAAFYST